MPADGTTDTQIKRYFRGSPYFGGCYFKDQLVHLNPQDKFWIVNMQNSTDGDGTHWVLCFCIPIKHRGTDANVYLDPIGAPPPDAIADFMNRCNEPFVSENKELQNLTSDKCGQVASVMATYLLSKARLIHLNTSEKMAFTRIIPSTPGRLHFNQDTTKNDRIFTLLFNSRCPQSAS